ncbi:hypothetical protein WJX81_008325 [Elliptochloris bilobata]|uniref:Protein kinase domain-containing protein n=1 Tax=Elliptochloris bilobata TaxID=381761 RepID=A0AAW1QIF3_9CHLO
MALGTQDYITPADQQFDGTADTGEKARHMRSPAVISPDRIKRPRNAAGLRGAALEGPCGSQLSQSQADERYASVPSTSDAGLGLGVGSTPAGCMGPPAPRRARSPPCARNVFLESPGDASDASGLPRTLPVVKRYDMEYREVVVLGRGNFSKVTKVKCRLDGMEYAAKRSSHPLHTHADKKRWQQEVMAMAAAGVHANIVRYHCAWAEVNAEEPYGGHHIYILMEPCTESLGMRRLVTKAPMREAELLEVLRQMAEALQHLHARDIAHLDVKPDNIFTTPAGVYKLGDFGLASPCAGGKCTLSPDEGDSRYLAPEALANDWRAPDKADMFALGASVYELATGQELPTSGSKYKDLRQGRLSLLPGLTSPVQKLLHALMAPEPADRPSAAKVLASPPLVDKSVFTITKLYRDSLRLANYVSSRPGGANREVLWQMVRGAFRKNADETDPEKIEKYKEAAIQGLCNYMFIEAQRMAKEQAGTDRPDP